MEYARHKGVFARINDAFWNWWIDRLDPRLRERAKTHSLADIWTFTRKCHHCGQNTWSIGPCCCFCGGDEHTPHVRRVPLGMPPCCNICSISDIQQLPQQSATLQQSRKVGEIDTHTGIRRAVHPDGDPHRYAAYPAKVYMESRVSGKLQVPQYQERDTPVPGVRHWHYDDDDTQPREKVV